MTSINVKKLRCFTCCVQLGALVFNTSPLAYLGCIDGNELGSLSVACMLDRSNIFAVVGGGNTPKFSENIVMIWNEKQKQFELEYRFPSPVLSVIVGRCFVAVALKSSVEIFDFPLRPEQRVATLKTWPNWRGLLDIRWPLIACSSSVNCGFAQLLTLQPQQQQQQSPTLVSAHKSQLAALRLAPNARLLATASQRGTILRIFCSATSRLLLQLRRGTDAAALHSIDFSADCSLLCAISDKGSLHFWPISNCRSSSSTSVDAGKELFDTGVRPSATFALPAGSRFVVAFADGRHLAAVGFSGQFHRILCNGSAVVREAFDKFIEMATEPELV